MTRVNPDDKPLGDVASQLRQDERAIQNQERETRQRAEDRATQAERDHRSWMQRVFVDHK